MLNRAYSILEIKSVDEEQRVIEGIASTPEPDGIGHVMVPEGAKFTLPLPLLWQHRGDEPIGNVTDARVTKAGIFIKAQILKISEAGTLRDRLDEAWQSIKHKLVRGLSIGWSPIADPEPIRVGTELALKFPSWEWLELSAVTIPLNHATTITAIKSIAMGDPAASGAGSHGVARPSAGGSALVVKASHRRTPMKTFQEQIDTYQAQRESKDAERKGIMTKSAESGETLNAEQSEQFDTLTAEIKAIDEHIERLKPLVEANVAAAREVKGRNLQEGASARTTTVIQMKQTLDPGIEFARMVMVKVHARLEGMSAVEMAKARYPDQPRIQQYLQKAAVPAASTTNDGYLGALVDPTNLASEFVEFLRPMTIIGKFGQGGVPSLRRVPFNVRILGQTVGGEGYWVGQGAGKPVTSMGVAPTTLTFAKVANIAVLTEEIVRFSSPSAEAMVRDELARAIIERIDTDFVDPAKAAVANVSPASITNGLVALPSAGTSADNARTDIQNLLEQFILNNVDPTSLVLIMPNTLALALSVQVNSLGQPEFPGLTMRGGNLLGIPVITSQYAANQSGAGNLVIAVNASDIFLADDGQVSIDMSRETSLQMSDAPTINSVTGTGASLVSMFQTNSVALRAERFINWARRRTTAVVYMDDVNWGAVGSPS